MVLAVRNCECHECHCHVVVVTVGAVVAILCTNKSLGKEATLLPNTLSGQVARSELKHGARWSGRNL